MTYLIDRRKNSKNKSAVNRQRFMRRYQEEIRNSVEKKLRDQGITETDRGMKVRIPTRNTREPIFHHGPGGNTERVYPGNRKFSAGDKIERPPQGAGEPGKNGSPDGESMDEFVFEISRREFLDLLFEDMALPNLTRKQLVDNEEFKFTRAGFAQTGPPSNINVVRSMRSALARRVALGANKRRALRELIAEREDLLARDPVDTESVAELDDKIQQLRERINRVPFIDEIDLRYHQHVKQPQPRSKAVMFCVMDVSGSMDQSDKDLAKRFFILLYLFLNRHYEKTEVVFVRHHTTAKEVDEKEFFYSRESGGTVVSSALQLVKEIIDGRYPSSEWNLYIAQASDGDNWHDDGHRCEQLVTQLLPQIQYFAYIEIAKQDKPLWQTYARFEQAQPQQFAMQHITRPADIYPVLRNLFQKQDA